MMSYIVEDISELGYPRVVRMSFELPYLNWCRFENSNLYRNLIAYLSELQREENLILQREKKD